MAEAIVREEEAIARHLPLRAATATFERWVEVPDEDALVAAVRFARAEKHAIRVVSPFADALPPEGGLTGTALRLGEGFAFVRDHPDGVEIGAAAPLALLGRREGFGAFRTAPGTLGDALEEGWIAAAVVRVRRFRGRGFEEVESAEPEGKAIVVSGVLRRGAKVTPPRAGTAFREPKKRGLSLHALLARAGVATLRLHGAALADDDPAVLVNRGDASPRQLRLLLGAVRERVHVATGIELEDRLVAPGRGGRSS